MKTVLTYLGIVASALAASACCWIPALLGAGAAGSLGLSAAFAPWRPYLLGLSGVLLLVGFRMVYRKPAASCCNDDGCLTAPALKRRKVSIGVMWVVFAFAITMAAFPDLLAARAQAARSRPTISTQRAASQATFRVEGMDCEACALPIRTELEKVPGVVSAQVDFDHKRVLVKTGQPQPTSTALMAAITRAGFKSTPEGD